MTFSYTKKKTDTWGHWRVRFGTWTNGAEDGGGEIDTGLGNVMACFLQKTGNGTTTDGAVVNETFPDLAGPNVTIVTKNGDDGIWMAIESQAFDNTKGAINETTVFDYTRVGNKRMVIGNIVDGGNGAVALNLTDVLNKVDWIILQMKDSSVSTDNPSIDETFPMQASQSGGATVACTASKTYYFLACGSFGGN